MGYVGFPPFVLQTGGPHSSMTRHCFAAQNMNMISYSNIAKNIYIHCTQSISDIWNMTVFSHIYVQFIFIQFLHTYIHINRYRIKNKMFGHNNISHFQIKNTFQNHKRYILWTHKFFVLSFFQPWDNGFLWHDSKVLHWCSNSLSLTSN